MDVPWITLYIPQVPLPRKVLGKSTREGCTDKDAFQLQVNITLSVFCLSLTVNSDLQEKLYEEYQIEVPVKCLEGRLFVRLSAHIYNDIEEYKKLAIVIRNWP